MNDSLDWVRASFLHPNGSEMGIFHPTSEKAAAYLTSRLQHYGKAQGTWSRRFGAMLFTCKKQVKAVYQQVRLDLTYAEVFTIVYWLRSRASIEVSHSLDDVGQRIKEKGIVDPSLLIWEAGQDQSRFYSPQGLVLTVTRETVDKYRQLREVMINLAERRKLKQE